MAVNRAHVTQPHLLEDQAAAEPAAAVARQRAGTRLLEGRPHDRALEGFLGLVTEFEGDVTLGQAFRSNRSRSFCKRL
jgi:hypothetical protein